MLKPPFSTRRIIQLIFVFLGGYTLFALVGFVLSEKIAIIFTAEFISILVIFISIVCVAFACRIIRWLYLLKTMGVLKKNNIVVAIQIYLGGFPMVFSPGRIGELWRAWALKIHCQAYYRQALPVIICDRLFDLNVLLIFAALGIFIAPAFHIPATIALIVLVTLIFVLIKPSFFSLFVKLIWRIIGRPVPRHFAALLSVSRRIERHIHPAVYFPSLFLSLLAWGIEVIGIVITLLLLNGEISVLATASTLGISNLVGLIILLPAGIGGQEITMSYLLHAIGNTWGVAIVTMSIARIGTIFFGTLLGAPFFIKLSRLSNTTES